MAPCWKKTRRGDAERAPSGITRRGDAERAPSGKPGDEDRGEQLRVLVVDDEPIQLESIRRGLFLYGYWTLGASSGEEAMNVMSGTEGKRVDVLVTDLTMPGATGFELIEELRQSRPEMPIVAITGLALSAQVEAIRSQGILILQKPFSPDHLDGVIRALISKLDESGSH